MVTNPLNFHSILLDFLHFARNVTKCFLLVALLSACVSKDIYQNRSFNPPVYFGTHKVREGETLYAISWRYGRDFRELAKANNIAAPYTIFPGQKINLERSEFATSEGAKIRQGGETNRPAVTERKANNENRTKITKLKKQKSVKNLEWQWPHLGPILAKYNMSAKAVARNQANKGIDISGAVGDPIFAAESGEVVYAGNGLLGYGQLIIVNHDAYYLSAYAHNRRLLVKEGQQIKKGQKIAEMGSTGTDRPKLHFQIRKEGNPVNPERYLPKK